MNDTWKISVVSEPNHDYHMVHDGVLSKEDFSVLFSGDEGYSRIPVDMVESLNVYSSVDFSAGLFEFLGKENIGVNIINKFGVPVGRFVPSEWTRNIDVEIQQIKLYNNMTHALRLAKTYQKANIFNIRAVLRYYERRNHCDFISEKICEISNIIKKINAAESIETLSLYEARARLDYYECFNYILSNSQFHYTGRTRRPPLDPLNAMISFGNTLLYNRVAGEIYRSSLDIRIGILHSPRKRYENLHLDIADLFKPVLVDRTIFTLVNKGMIHTETDFVVMENGGVYMTASGKKVFIQEFEKKLSNTVIYEGKKYSYMELIRREVRKLEDFYRKGTAYKPYIYVN